MLIKNFCKITSIFTLFMLITFQIFAGEIHEAVIHGDIERVRSLLQSNSELINIKGEQGNFAIHLAADNGHLEIINLLLNNGADVHKKK